MRSFALCILASFATAIAQENAWSLAWSSVGEAVGDAMPLGQGQPAALGWAVGTVLSVSTVPQLYGLPGLRSGGIGGTHGRDGAGLGSEFTVLEAGATRRLGARLNGGLILVENISAGLGLELARWSFARYGSIFEGEATIGAQVRTDRLSTGMALTLRVQEYRRLSVGDLRIAVGSAVQVSEEVAVIAEAIEAGALEVRMGVRATIIDELAFILSWSDGAEVVGAGLDLRIAEWRAIAGGRWHPLLGWSHGLDLLFAWR